MFNWFKSKVELKNNNSIMSSFYNKKGLKLGSEISIPEHFEGLIFYKGKHYNTLTSGKHKVDNKTFSDLISRQQRKKSNKKYVKCVCHYVNLSLQTIEICVKKQKFIVEFEINNSLLFANLILLYSFKVDNDYTQLVLAEVLTELLSYRKYDYTQINSNDLENYGIIIKSFTPKDKKNSIFNNNLNISVDKSVNNVSILSKLENNAPNQSSSQTNIDNDINQPQSTPQPSTSITTTENNNSNNPQTIKPAQYVCPNCGNVSKFSTTYCLKCGYKIE